MMMMIVDENFDETLDEMLTQSKSSSGRQLMAAKSNGHISKLCNFLNDFSQYSSKLENIDYNRLLNVFSILRNICISSFANAQAIAEYNIQASCIHICKSEVLTNIYNNKSNVEDTTYQTSSSLCIAICQFYSNFVANGSRFSYYLLTNEQLTTTISPEIVISYEEFLQLHKHKNININNIFNDLIAYSMKTKSRKALAACISTLYISMRYEDNLGRAFLHYFCNNRSLLCQILLSIMTPFNQTVASAPEAAESDPVMEWIHIWILYMLQRNKISTIFNCIEPTIALTNLPGHFSHEQLILLQVIEQLFEDSSCNEVVSNVFKAIQHDQPFTPVEDNPSYDLFTLSKTIAAKLVSINIFGDKTSEEQGEVEEDVRMLADLNRDGVPIALEVISSVLSLFEYSTQAAARALKTALVDINLVQFCGTCLSHYKSPIPIVTDIDTQSGLKYRGEESLEDVAILGVKRRTICAVLQLLGNIVHKCTEAQDALRECGAFASVLSLCGTDFHNPLSREWAILCVRNACADNIANQSFVDSLRPKGAIVDDRLAAMGVTVQINAETGQFQFNQTK